MFDTHSNRNFNSAPQSVTAFIATVLEPAITVAVYVAAMAWHNEPIGRADLTLCFLVVALTWQGINRFHDRLSSSAVGILGSWLTLLAILAGFGYGTRSLDLFDRDVILFWAIATPLLQLLAVRLGFLAVRRQSADPHNRRSAVVIGASTLGVKVAHALSHQPAQGIDFLGYFGDRADARVHADSSQDLLTSRPLSPFHSPPVTARVRAPNPALGESNHHDPAPCPSARTTPSRQPAGPAGGVARGNVGVVTDRRPCGRRDQPLVPGRGAVVRL